MKVFLFDIGNVLCDFDYDKLLNIYEEISKKSVTIDTLWDQQMYTDVEAGKISDQEYVELVNHSKNINWKVQDLIYAWKKIFSENKIGRILYYHAIQQKTNVYTLSNIADYHVKAINENWPNLLTQASGLFFSYVIGSRKPDPKIYEYALRSLSVNPDQCFFIDDLEENIKMARTLGMNAYQFVPENYELIFNKANSFFSWDKKCILKY